MKRLIEKLTGKLLSASILTLDWWHSLADKSYMDHPAFDRGFNAFEHGHNNPFEPGSKEHKLWKKGYNLANDRRMREW